MSIGKLDKFDEYLHSDSFALIALAFSNGPHYRDMSYRIPYNPDLNDNFIEDAYTYNRYNRFMSLE